jgi:uncharacterized protein
MSFSRRNFLKIAGVTAAGAALLDPLETLYARVANGQVANGIGYGPLYPKMAENADELVGTIRGGIDLGLTPILSLPKGFNYTAISITGQQMDDGGTVPAAHDGMAAFSAANNTTILVRNHEVGANGSNPVVPYNGVKYDRLGGGTTSVVVGPERLVRYQYASLGGTIRNCAGGPTPWGSWITCEEDTSGATGGNAHMHGYNFEVPASAELMVADPIPLVAMGRFNHEAVAVEPETGYVFQTEDRGDSLFYRFRSNVAGELSQGGILEALKITDSRARNVDSNGSSNTVNNYRDLLGEPLAVTWVQIPNPNPATDTVRVQGRGLGAARFSRGEGAWYGNGRTYFVCSDGGNDRVGQVWAYESGSDPSQGTLTLVVEARNTDPLAAPDNICVAPWGDLYLCEDGSGSEYVVGVSTRGELFRFAENSINSSEFAGACFSPDGKTLFVNLQSPGITLAIWGPWTRHRS